MASKYLFIILVALPMMILANEAVQPIVKLDASSLNYNNYKNCPVIKGCTFETDDCRSFKCTHQVLGETFTFAMKIDVCNKDAKVTITIRYSSYTKTITVFNGKIDVPLVGFSSATDLYLRTEATRGSDGNIHLKLSLGFKILSYDKLVKIVDHKFDNTKPTIDECDCPAIKGCTFETDDCTSFKCTHQVLRERFIFAMKMDVCGKDAKVTITISYSSYTKTITVFNGKKDVPLVGFSSAADLYLRTEVTRGSGENIHLKLSLGFKILSFGKSVKILDHKFDNTEVSIDKCGFLKWLSAQETGVQAGIYGGFALVVLSIIACIGCCCCCYKRRKSPGVIVAAGQGGPNVQMETRTELPTNIGTEYVKF